MTIIIYLFFFFLRMKKTHKILQAFDTIAESFSCVLADDVCHLKQVTKVKNMREVRNWSNCGLC